MKISRVLLGALLVCAAACSSPTAPALPSDPIPAPSPDVMTIPHP